MMWYLIVLASVISLADGECVDTVSRKTPLIIRLPDRNVTVNSCKKAVRQYPAICASVGGEDQSCCASCSEIGTPTCLDKASRKQALSVTINQKNFQVKTCKVLLKKNPLMPLCSPDAFGGEDHSCCQSCKDTCVDSITWRLNSRKCKDCNCVTISQVPGLMEKCCENNMKGKGADNKTYRCQDMCCDSCSAMRK